MTSTSVSVSAEPLEFTGASKIKLFIVVLIVVAVAETIGIV